ncbi:unnamed protein product [Staurois parvus]|uniref:Uncharacterized protein n=1 Tax=Staurois parvus TaxID=386267 RepID=A0ABN9FZE9_9NEOB|nr:unnamed protein product [Staurois parvus]
MDITVRDPTAVASSPPQTGLLQDAESNPRPACSPGPLMVGIDLEQAETRSRPLGSPSCGRSTVGGV